MNSLAGHDNPDASALHKYNPQQFRLNGWIIGITIGVFATLLALPPVRYTLLAQLQFAIAERSFPLLHSMTVRPTKRDVALLDSIASASPDEYLLQVGRATVMAGQGGLQARDNSRASGGDNTLYRLGALVQAFPEPPGGYAHLSRYMMNDRIRLERDTSYSTKSDTHGSIAKGRQLSATDPTRPTNHSGSTLDPYSSHQPTRGDLKVTLWALHSGERRDPDNAFWPAMLATTYFAAHRDQEGMDALRRASVRVHWDAYIYEEVLGEWRLFSAAYGDNGAIQKLGPLTVVSFPHLREIRKMAQFVRSIAEQAAEDGNESKAINLRRELMLLGTVMLTRAQWAYEALIGTDLCLIAGTDSHSSVSPANIRSEAEWEPHAAGYLALLRRTNHKVDIAWLRQEIDSSCTLRNRIDLARYDASYPGIPPGIPLAPLFGSWMTGVCLIQQVITLFAMVCIVFALESLRSRALASGSARRGYQCAQVVIAGGWIASGFTAFSGTASTGYMLLFLLFSTAVILLSLQWFTSSVSNWPRRQAVRSKVNANVSKADAPAGRAGWGTSRSALAVALVTVPTLIGLYLMQSLLSTMHPVAGALTSLVDIPHSTDVMAALQIALVGSLAPLIALVGLAIWALGSRSPVLPRICTALRRTTLPTVGCLMLAYVMMLNRTILMDAAASRAISEAAKNDLQWVLTHSGEQAGVQSNK